MCGDKLHAPPSSLLRDKFLITTVFLETSELEQQQLVKYLKTSKPDGQYRLRCELAEKTGLGGDGQEDDDGQGQKASLSTKVKIERYCPFLDCCV